MSHADVEKLKKGTNTHVDVEAEAKAVFIAWIGTQGVVATRQAVLTALGKSNLNLAKENLTELWGKGIIAFSLSFDEKKNLIIKYPIYPKLYFAKTRLKYGFKASLRAQGEVSRMQFKTKTSYVVLNG